MKYQDAIIQHDLHIANHRYTEDVLSQMRLTLGKTLSCSQTLAEIMDEHKKKLPLLMLRKESFGWRFRLLINQKQQSTHTGYTWFHQQKLSYLMCWHNCSYNQGKYVYTLKDKPTISAAFSVLQEYHEEMHLAWHNLRTFVYEYTKRYEKIRQEVIEKKELEKAKLVPA